MKKIILSLAVLLFGATQMMAQTTVAHDTVHYFGFPKDGGAHALKDSIINSSVDTVTVTWNKSSETLLTGWSGVGICDPANCFQYDSVSHSAKLAPGKTGIWYVDMSAIPTAQDGSSYVTVTTNFGDMTFKFTSWATQVKNFENNNIVTIYPNPATSYVNIAINDNRVSTINVMNVVGKKVGRFAVDANTPNPIHIPLDNVTDGVYLLQFTDASGKLLGVRRVTKN